MNENLYLELRSAVPFQSVSLGYMRVTLFKPDKLAKVQIGYSVGPEGEKLTGSEKGDWKDTWFVIADEDQCGDPIFVDLASKDLPVYTAVHGEGDWEPELIADSFQGFIQSLEQVRSVSMKRESPTAALKRIKQINPNTYPRFWEQWLLG